MSDMADPKYQAMLEFIVTFVDSHGYGPTIREMGDELGISSTSVVSYRMHILQREGRLTWEEGRSRTVRVIDVDGGIVIRLSGEEARMFHDAVGHGDPQTLLMEAIGRDLRTRAHSAR